MKKLSFEELSRLADEVAENTLLEQISGGTSNDCHDTNQGVVRNVKVNAVEEVDDLF